MNKKILRNGIIISLLLIALIIDPQKLYYNFGFDKNIEGIANSLLTRAYPEEEFEILDISYSGGDVYNLKTESPYFFN